MNVEDVDLDLSKLKMAVWLLLSRHAVTTRELSKSLCECDRLEPQFFSSFVLASGVASYRLELGIYRRAHSFLLAGHFIRTGSWALASLRLTSPLFASPRLTLARGRYRINVSLITYPADATPPFSSIGVSPLPHLPHPFCSTDPSPPPTAFRLHHLYAPLSLTCSLFPSPSLSFSHVIPRSRFFPLHAVSSSTYRHLLLVLLILQHVMAPRVKETNVYLKN